MPARDLFIEKDSSVNKHIEQMRLSATKALMERRDCLIVATVSAIYGIGDPVDYHSMILHLKTGETARRDDIIKRLVDMQYQRNPADFARGNFRVRGDTVDVHPAENAEDAVRIELEDDRVASLHTFDPLTGRKKERVPRWSVYPSSHYAAPRDTVARAMKTIRAELADREAELRRAGKNAEADRLAQRTLFDLEMMETMGFCKGIENYSRHLSGAVRASRRRPCLTTCRRTRFCLLTNRTRPFRNSRDVSRRPRAKGDAGAIRIPPAVGAGQPPVEV